MVCPFYHYSQSNRPTLYVGKGTSASSLGMSEDSLRLPEARLGSVSRSWLQPMAPLLLLLPRRKKIRKTSGKRCTIRTYIS